MGEALNVLGVARRAPKKAPSSLSPPVVGRVVLGAIRACTHSSHGAHLASSALERGLAESEQRHARGSQFLHTTLVDPILSRVGGPVAAAVVKCCLLGVGPQPLGEQGGADMEPSSSAAVAAAAAAAAQNKYLAETTGVDESDLAAAPELVPGAVLGRLSKLVHFMNVELAPLRLLEHNYSKTYKAAKDASAKVVDAAEALCKRVDAAAAAAAGARKPKADFLPDLLDDSNDEFNHFFAEVDAKLLRKMAESFEGTADASTARVEKAYSALQASMDRHQAKELRDTMMLRSLRRIAEGGGEGGAPVPVLAAILDAYEAAVEAKRLNSAADLAAAEVSAAAADAAAASAAAAAFARPAAAPACTAAVPVAACNKNKNKNQNRIPNCSGCGCCGGGGGGDGGARPTAASAPSAPTPPAHAFIEPAAYAPLYRLFFADWVTFLFFFAFFLEREMMIKTWWRKERRKKLTLDSW